eukprot:1193124-Amphidinium_carterae.1
MKLGILTSGMLCSNSGLRIRDNRGKCLPDVKELDSATYLSKSYLVQLLLSETNRLLLVKELPCSAVTVRNQQTLPKNPYECNAF